MDLRKELMDRLICAKYLFRKGVEATQRRDPFSSGLAVLHFQDAAEMTIRVIAERLDCHPRENAQFGQIIDEIDRVGDSRVPMRSALNQLNKARVNFKHFGLEPKREDADKFRRDLEEFFPAALRIFLDIDFNSLSLACLIGHKRTENYLSKAERFIGEQKCQEAIDAAASAFAIFEWHSNRYPDIRRIDELPRSDDREFDRWAKGIQRAVTDLQSQVDLIMNGVDLADYRRFQRYAPNVYVSQSGQCSTWDGGSYRESAPDREDALFCHRFVIDAILTMKANQVPPRLTDVETSRRFRVTRECRVVVVPRDDAEVIRLATPGEVLTALSSGYDQPGYVAIVQDGDEAYIDANAVSEIHSD